MDQVMRAVQDGDVPAFVNALKREPWLLGDACVGFQKGLIERATMRDRAEFIVALLDLDPALVRRQPPPAIAGHRVRAHLCEDRTSFRCSLASGHCRTTCRMRQAWEISRA